jgi:dihydroflavonol-4-reductase
LHDAAALRAGLAGCDWVFHVAGLYAFWGYSWAEFCAANVEGTRRLLQAAGEAGVRRIVHTSSIATLGLARGTTLADETTPVTEADMVGLYKRSKFLAEEVAREFSRQGLPVVIVNPATPVGVGDYKPTQTGRLIVDFLNDRIPAYVDTGLTIVDVDDVATGHLLAMANGRVGERYILGGETLTLKQVLDTLAAVAGCPPVRWRIPHLAALGWAYLDTGLAQIRPRHVPQATPEAVRVSWHPEYYSSGKAMRELGYTFGPARDALAKAVHWYRQHGYVRASSRR